MFKLSGLGQDQNSTDILLITICLGHAFSVTQIKDIKTPTGIVSLVRCLNPWSNFVEWNGDWSDQ